MCCLFENGLFKNGVSKDKVCLGLNKGMKFLSLKLCSDLCLNIDCILLVFTVKDCLPYD